MDAGADICVVSVHKMGTGFEQGSVFHVQGDRVDFPHLSACADLLMTTSPNVLLYAAIDGWRRQMVEHGRELLAVGTRARDRVTPRMDELPGLHVLEDDLVREAASHDLDRLQILIDVSELQISGYQAADWLREHERIDMGLSDHARVLATVSIADDRVDRAAACSRGAARRLIHAARQTPEAHDGQDPPNLLTLSSKPSTAPATAFFSQYEDVDAQAQSVGSPPNKSLHTRQASQ